MIGVVIPVGPDRLENLRAVLGCLDGQLLTQPPPVVVVTDGFGLPSEAAPYAGELRIVEIAKHAPGMEQPRNVGVRALMGWKPDATHAWFLDSDVIVGDDCLLHLELALNRGPHDRTLVAPYEWMPAGARVPMPSLFNDPRWAMFRQSPPDRVYHGDLSAGLACFSGNLLWSIAEFTRVGGYWSEIHHGRCEDGELGLRAVAMGVGISMAPAARGWHLWHPRDEQLIFDRNARDVPMLNARHPWLQAGGVTVVEREGRRFEVRCPVCELSVNTGEWWGHAAGCGVTGLPV